MGRGARLSGYNVLLPLGVTMSTMGSAPFPVSIAHSVCGPNSTLHYGTRVEGGGGVDTEGDIRFRQEINT